MKDYQPPQLTAYGRVAALTTGSSGAFDDYILVPGGTPPFVIDTNNPTCPPPNVPNPVGCIRRASV